MEACGPSIEAGEIGRHACSSLEASPPCFLSAALCLSLGLCLEAAGYPTTTRRSTCPASAGPWTRW